MGDGGGWVLQRHRQLKIVQLTQMWIYRGEQHGDGSLVESLWLYGRSVLNNTAMGVGCSVRGCTVLAV